MTHLDVVALAARLPATPRTRYAPSPTGYLHLGHVANAVMVWGLAGVLGGRVLLRLETHDRIRSRPEYAAAIIEDLAWLGFEPDEGPIDQTDGTPYATALAELQRAGLVYVCTCSRRDWASAEADAARYSGHCRDAGLGDAPGRTLRLRVTPGPESFYDGCGARLQQDAASGGDIILRDRDGHWSYHLAVAVDDHRQQVDLVIRGADLLDATGVQVQLARQLGRHAPPAFVHHALITAPDGRKLSKSNQDAGVRELRAAGVSAADVIGMAARAAGLTAITGGIPARDIARLFETGARTAHARAGILG